MKGIFIKRRALATENTVHCPDNWLWSLCGAIAQTVGPKQI